MDRNGDLNTCVNFYGTSGRGTIISLELSMKLEHYILTIVLLIILILIVNWLGLDLTHFVCFNRSSIRKPQDMVENILVPSQNNPAYCYLYRFP